ncbi:hypothetical protein CVT26_004254 [Gymnopilus dilepis]|uniref:Uncharacterized protein n=1 Tax=Gymnopilus dilepis TaxID=231916 RepID=A0A409YVI9_9AGAR|nr:hypothetical protein CVT26_004254 [Gymnopilus dilepis]
MVAANTPDGAGLFGQLLGPEDTADFQVAVSLPCNNENNLPKRKRVKTGNSIRSKKSPNSSSEESVNGDEQQLSNADIASILPSKTVPMTTVHVVWQRALRLRLTHQYIEDASGSQDATAVPSG